MVSCPEDFNPCLHRFPDGLIGHEDSPDEEQFFQVPRAEAGEW
jgi:hypothetical protein